MLPKSGKDLQGIKINMHTLLYLTWITNTDLLYTTGNPAQCYVPAWMQASLDTCICVAEPLCCSAEIITTLLIAYTPVQNKKVFKKRIHKASDSSPATLEARRQRSHASASCGKITLSLVRLSIKWSTIQIFFKHARSQKFSF